MGLALGLVQFVGLRERAVLLRELEGSRRGDEVTRALSHLLVAPLSRVGMGIGVGLNLCV
jgi:hypothetical protein